MRIRPSDNDSERIRWPDLGELCASARNRPRRGKCRPAVIPITTPTIGPDRPMTARRGSNATFSGCGWNRSAFRASVWRGAKVVAANGAAILACRRTYGMSPSDEPTGGHGQEAECDCPVRKRRHPIWLSWLGAITAKMKAQCAPCGLSCAEDFIVVA